MFHLRSPIKVKSIQVHALPNERLHPEFMRRRIITSSAPLIFLYALPERCSFIGRQLARNHKNHVWSVKALPALSARKNRPAKNVNHVKKPSHVVARPSNANPVYLSRHILIIKGPRWRALRPAGRGA